MRAMVRGVGLPSTGSTLSPERRTQTKARRAWDCPSYLTIVRTGAGEARPEACRLKHPSRFAAVAGCRSMTIDGHG